MPTNKELIDSINTAVTEKNMQPVVTDGLNNTELQSLLKEVKAAPPVAPPEELDEMEPMPDYVIARGKCIVRNAEMLKEGEEVTKKMFNDDSWKAHLKVKNIVKGDKY